MAIDNHEIVATFMPSTEDGDTFLYTEILDRSKATGGNNRVRLLRSFHHRSRAHFLDTWPTIQKLCDQTGMRAYTRLSPRSYRKVGQLFSKMVWEMALDQRWPDMRPVYDSACGRSAPIHGQKLWLFDVDAISEETDAFRGELDDRSLLKAIVPSRKGEHLIVKPFEFDGELPPATSLHKDNPTNLYIPDHAA